MILGWLVFALVVLMIAAVALGLARRAADRAATRALHRFHTRVNRFKLTRKPYIRTTLLGDPDITEAVRVHAAEQGMSEADTWKRVDRYIDEIVPHFNILAYYKFGYAVSRVVINFLYKVTVDYEDLASLEQLPADASVIYLINHRSNADYVVVAYVLAGDVSISYAVGEWARAFPLEYVFKSFGSYFIRRSYREPLYHTVLERYVQLITRNGVTQGIFPEGGLSRDGLIRPGKIGLLDYALRVGRDPSQSKRMHLIPVALNYDRVLEDRTLLRELRRKEPGTRVPRWKQFGEVMHYLGWNLARLATGRWRRYGRTAVTIGRPMALEPWFVEQRAREGDFFSLPKDTRLPIVQALCDRVMERIGALIPVTPVPLACAAIQSFDSDFITRAALLERMSEMRDVLLELNAHVLRADSDIAVTFDRAWRMLKMRKMLVEQGSGFAVMSRQRELISYYANSIAHLLGPFERGVRERDAFPADEVTGQHSYNRGH